MTTDQLIAQLVAALRGMTPTQHTSSCMEHEGGVVDGPDGRRVGVGPLVVGTCQCPERVQVARAALDAAAPPTRLSTGKMAREATEQKRQWDAVQEFERETGLAVTGDSWRQKTWLKSVGRRLRLLEQVETDASGFENMLLNLRERAESIQKLVAEVHPLPVADRKEGFPFTMPSPFTRPK